MTRELNQQHMVPLTDTFPVHRLGPGGDVAKVSCATCHQGAHKPLYGAEMAKHHPELLTKSPPPATTPAATPGTAALTAEELKVLEALPTAAPKAAGAG